MIVGSNLQRIYGKGSVEVRALDGVDISIRKGEFVGITGASGSGKSTLLHLLGLLDRPTSGKPRYRWRGSRILKRAAADTLPLKPARVCLPGLCPRPRADRRGEHLSPVQGAGHDLAGMHHGSAGISLALSGSGTGSASCPGRCPGESSSGLPLPGHS